MKPTILILVGPTAVGKTGYGIRLAEALSGEIVSADSMQLYQQMEIGSAKPTRSERAIVPHFLVDFIDPLQPISVAEYQNLAMDAITDILSRKKLPVISGGTGLYINSLLYQMDFSEVQEEPLYRRELEIFAEREGKEAVHNKLHELDPDVAARIHPNNLKKVIRALEQIQLGNTSPKEFQSIRQQPGKYRVVLIGLTRQREELYLRIEQRVDLMMQAGLVEEVQLLKKYGLTDTDRSMMAIGYKEMLWYLDGKIDLDEAIRRIKQASRNYAKRQMTWFRSYPDIKWFDVTGKECPDGIEEILIYAKDQISLEQEV